MTRFERGIVGILIALAARLHRMRHDSVCWTGGRRTNGSQASLNADSERTRQRCDSKA